jgi:hypothetical protein
MLLVEVVKVLLIAAILPEEGVVAVPLRILLRLLRIG